MKFDRFPCNTQSTVTHTVTFLRNQAFWKVCPKKNRESCATTTIKYATN